jgi:uncharacterized protein (TIGR03663 family)
MIFRPSPRSSALPTGLRVPIDSVRPLFTSRNFRLYGWPILCTALLLFFAVTRLYDLRSRPIHHDEGVNGMFMKNLVESGTWKYDPENYHGPTLYYIHLVPTWIASYVSDGWSKFNRKSLSGISIVPLRFVVALAGILFLWMILRSDRMLGRIGAATACILAGLSCDVLYFSRYFIHETYLILFTFGFVSFGYLYLSTRRVRYAYLSAVSATLFFCTKETSSFHLVIFVIAGFMTLVVHWLSGNRQEPAPWVGFGKAIHRFLKGFGVHLALIAVVCLLVWAALFTSFFRNPSGLLDSFRTLMYWGAEGVDSGHEKPFLYYFNSILFPYETVPLILSCAGIVAAFIRNEKKGLFFSFWMMGMVFVYSAIPYKTPWLVLNMVLPMIVLSGYAVQCLVDFIRQRLARPHAMVTLTALAVVATALLTVQAQQTYRVNYAEPDNDRHPQVYAHTLKEINRVMTVIEEVSAGAGKGMTIHIFSEEYWPLPLYLLKYPGVKFWSGRVRDCKQIDAPILIVRPKLQAEVDSRVKDSYAIRNFNLRPGVPMALYINQKANSQFDTTRTLVLKKSIPAPAVLMPGLRLETFRKADFTIKPSKVFEGDTSFQFNWQGDNDRKFKAPFALRWTGFLFVPEPGTYRFGLESDDGSWLEIDGTMVIDNGGDHAATKLTRQVELSAGYHRVEIRYYDVVGEAILKLTWAPPRAGETQVPAEVFFHQP